MTSHPEQTRTVFLGQLFDDGSCIFEGVFEHASARRDAVVEHLLANYPGADAARDGGREVHELLAPFGGANADVALREVYDLFSDEGVDMHLSEVEVPVVLPQRLYAAFTDYADGDGSTALAVFATRQERSDDLAGRLRDMGEDVDEGASEDELIEAFTSRVLAPTGGAVHVHDLDLVEGAWVGDGS